MDNLQMNNKKELMVSYGNEINKMSFSGFGSKDMDLFFSIVFKVMNQEDNQIDISVKDIINISNYKRISKSNLLKYLETTYNDKIYALRVKIKINNQFSDLPLFNYYHVDGDNMIVSVKINPEVIDLFNNAICFTNFDLLTYVSINSKYAKILFANLAQFRDKKTKSGWWLVNIEEFERIFCLPESLERKRYMDKIILPAIKCLEKYINIKCESIKDENKKGRPINAFRFDFKFYCKDEIVEELEISESNKLLDMLTSEIFLNEKEKEIIKKVLKDNDLTQNDVRKVIDCFKNTNADNKIALLRDMLQHPSKYHTPKKTQKINDFNNFESSEYDVIDIESRILAN